MNSRYGIFLILAAFISFASCKNNDNVFPKKTSAFVNVVNASTDTLNFYLNGTRQNNNSSLFPIGQTFYLPVPAGADAFQFKKAGTIPILFSVPVTLKDSVNYSVYLSGETADKTFTTVDSLKGDSGLTSVKFVNMSPDAGALSVTIGDTLYFKNSAYKTSSRLLITGNGLKHVKVYLAGAAMPRVDTVLTVAQNSIYTIFSKGLLNGKGNAVFGVGLVLNGRLTL